MVQNKLTDRRQTKAVRSFKNMFATVFIIKSKYITIHLYTMATVLAKTYFLIAVFGKNIFLAGMLLFKCLPPTSRSRHAHFAANLSTQDSELRCEAQCFISEFCKSHMYVR